jgi:outer membrane protein TolC
LRQESLALASLQIAQRQLELGDISTLVLLNAETSYLQAAIARIQAHASRLTDVAVVYQALGGSWSQESPGMNEEHVTRGGSR